jgi:hypothetical protein
MVLVEKLIIVQAFNETQRLINMFIGAHKPKAV